MGNTQNYEHVDWESVAADQAMTIALLEADLLEASRTILEISPELESLRAEVNRLNLIVNKLQAASNNDGKTVPDFLVWLRESLDLCPGEWQSISGKARATVDGDYELDNLLVSKKPTPPNSLMDDDFTLFVRVPPSISVDTRKSESQ